MRSRRNTRSAALWIICGALTGCASAPWLPEETHDDGLVPVPNAMLDELFVAPNVSLANYKRVIVDPVEVSFKDGWRKEHPDLGDHDYEVFRSRLAKMLHDRLVKEFAAGGYTVAESPDHDVLHVHAGIENADFPAPEVGAGKTTVVYDRGNMTLRIQAFDAPTGALVARARDKERDPKYRTAQQADRVAAMKLAQEIFDQWAEELRSAMDVAKVKAGARTPRQ